MAGVTDDTVLPAGTDCIAQPAAKLAGKLQAFAGFRATADGDA